MKLHQVFAHAAVHEQWTAPRVQIQDAHGNHVDSLDRRERRDVLLAVAHIHQKRRDGAEQEERALRDKDRGPCRAHGINHWRRHGGNEQQFGQHNGAPIVHHKHRAVEKDRSVEP